MSVRSDLRARRIKKLQAARDDGDESVGPAAYDLSQQPVLWIAHQSVCSFSAPRLMTNFNDHRYKPPRYTPYLRLWHWHDNHSLPTCLNKAAREVLYRGRRLKQKILTQRPRHGRDEYGDPLVARQDCAAPVRPFAAAPIEAVEARFRDPPRNEHLYNGDGSSDPHAFRSANGGAAATQSSVHR